MHTDRTTITRWARWTGTLVAFPVAGTAARIAVGNIDTLAAAAVGGAVAGAVLGLAQASIGGLERSSWGPWTAATATGFAVGLGVGARVVGFGTDTASLVVMGAICGAGIGIAQATATPMRATDRLLWALAMPGLWALGWLITSQVIVDADRQHALFGLSGALVTSASAGVLRAFRSRGPRAADFATRSLGSAVAG
jgi:hypothetical protein